MNALEIGFNALLKSNGEVVTFRDKQVRALVNRTGPKPSARIPANIALQNGAVIQFPSAMAKPNLGEIIFDVKDIKHEIGSVKYLGHCWECECETNV